MRVYSATARVLIVGFSAILSACGQTRAGASDSQVDAGHGACRDGQLKLGQWAGSLPIQRLRAGAGWLLFNTDSGFHRFDLQNLDDSLLAPTRAFGFVALADNSAGYDVFFTTETSLQAFSRSELDPVALLRQRGLSEVTADAQAAYVLTAPADAPEYFQAWDASSGMSRRLFSASVLWEVWADAEQLYWVEGDPKADARSVFAGASDGSSVQRLFEYSGWGQLLVDGGRVLLASRDGIQSYAAGVTEPLVTGLRSENTELVAASAQQGVVYWLQGSDCSAAATGRECARGELWRNANGRAEKLTELDGAPLTLIADAECVFWSTRVAAQSQEPATALWARPR